MLIGKTIEDGDAIKEKEINDEKSRRILVCGKTGSGKSYSIGVLLEEIIDKDDTIPVVIDPQGIYWTMAQPNQEQESELWEWDLYAEGENVNLLVPGDPIERYGGEDIVQRIEERGAKVNSLKINPSDLSNEMWVDLFDLDISELMGSTLYKAVKKARSDVGKDFIIDDIVDKVSKIKTHDKTKEAVLRKLDIAQGWDIFEKVSYTEIEELLDPNAINVIDLQTLEPSRYGLRNLVVAVLLKFLFRKRSVARRREALDLGSDMKKIWLAIDEAHNFCPSGKSTLSNDIITRWAKEGRQPGLSLIVASQQPSAIDSDVLTQCDVRIIHKLTNKKDIRSINALSEDYISNDISHYINKLSNVGEAVIIDDQQESIDISKIRPRKTEHGGWGA